jgi:hypothetical protein
MGNTRGGLRPGSLTNTSTNTVVKFHFNPHEFSISKSNTWEQRAGQGNNIPSTHFKEGGPQTLSLSLHFDTQPQGTPVTTVTNPLWKMMLVDSSQEEQRTGKSQPPVVEFAWGPLAFKAIITQMSEKFVLFSDAGVPLRSVVDVSLQQFVAETATADELGFTTANVPAPATQTVTSSDRIDLLAAGMTGAATGWRALASQNNISDPLNPVVGSSMNYTK